MSIRILRAGPLTTIQDQGRVGYQELGFTVSGAMDQYAFNIANILVGNQMNSAVLEFTFMGAKIEFMHSSIIAITGGDMSPSINNKLVEPYQAILVKAGDILEMSHARSGCRSYLAFANQLDIKSVLNSKSTDLKCGFGGWKGRALRDGDVIPFLNPIIELKHFSRRKFRKPNLHYNNIMIRVVLGLQEDYFTKEGIDTFFSESYTITNESNRMGYKLDGPNLEFCKPADIISDGIPLGSIQVPSNGKPIIMLSDRQTTGGYPKIGVVAAVDLPKLAQARAGCSINFKEISLKKAQKLYIKQVNELQRLQKRLGKGVVC